MCLCLCLSVPISVMSKLRKACLIMAIPFCHYFCNNSDSTGRKFMKFYIREFFFKLSREINVHKNVTIIVITVLADRYTFLIMYR